MANLVDANVGTADWTTTHARATAFRPQREPTTVVVPHPDDEALMFGGLVGALRDLGVSVHVVAVTDGDAAYGPADPTLAARRVGEQERSLEVLGVPPADVHRLRLPDGEVSSRVDEVASAIVALGDPVVVAPWHHDHHCDHEACGRAAARAVEQTGATLLGGLFWAWHHVSPADMAERLVALPLDPAAGARRLAALAHHRSQLGDEFGPPVLTAPLLVPMSWPAEFYVADDRT